MSTDFQIVQLTPPGRGAVATLLVEGSGAAAAVDRLLVQSENPSDKGLSVRRIANGEQVVVCRVAEDVVRLHCHGGRAAIGRIINALRQAGGQVADWKQWATEREDPLHAAARVALVEAPTRRTAGILLNQYAGALSKACTSIREMIDNGRTHDARAKLDELLEYAPCVLHLTEPWRVVVAGRPNVGKSSLVNALAGFDRAIVHAQPGTTRDALTTATAIDGWPVELIDTAGFHTTDDPIEQAGVRLAEERLAKADLVVLVTDAAVSWSKDDAALLAAWPGAILIHNKCDLPSAEGRRPDGLRVSALRGDGLPDLISSLGVRLVPCPLPPGQAVPWTTQQVDALRSTTEALRIGQTDQAVSLLGHLLTTRHWSE